MNEELKDFFENIENQEIKQDAEKWEPSLGSFELLKASAIIRKYGLKKYPADSWKEVHPLRYYNAALRHLFAIQENLAKNDDESGLPHLYHAICNLGFICELLKKELTKKNI